MYAWEHIQLTIDYIETHLAEKMTIETLAKIACLSPFYFQRLFKRLVQKPVMEYIRLRRMAKATELLLDKEKRIIDVSLELGFSSHEQFSRVFKETFQITPSGYRQIPRALNRMTKPILLLNYTLIDEHVPLVEEGIVLEIFRKKLEAPIFFSGYKMDMPAGFVAGLGIDSGEDPLAELWNRLHRRKKSIPGRSAEDIEIGVSFPSEKEGYFSYFAGTKVSRQSSSDSYQSWQMTEGEYIVCCFEAESFEDLVMDVLYKAQKYLFDVWLPKHGITTESFCLEYYEREKTETAAMEVWVKPVGKKAEG